MRVALVFLVVVIGALWWKRTHPSAATACFSPHADAVKVLFIGNSHTFVNDLPGAFCSIAEPAHAVTVKSVAMPAWTLRRHWEDGTARRAIEDEPWDWVVLQENSALPLEDFQAFATSVRDFDAVIQKVGARTIVYELWPRKDFLQDPAALEAAYVRAANDVHAHIARVGPAWIEALASHPDLRLHQDDGYHPRPLGTYLAACVFYASLFGESPVGQSRGIADPALATDLQRIAWHVTAP